MKRLYLLTLLLYLFVQGYAQTLIDGIYYNLDDINLTAEVTSVSSGNYSGSVTIPETVLYDGWRYVVISVGDYAFRSCSGLTSFTIPNSVTSIGRFAFYGCTGLTSLTIPNSVTFIGNWAFQYCSGLTSIEVESGNTVYDSRESCNAIINTSANELIAGCKTTIIPNSVTTIGDYAFYESTGLTSLTIPNSVTSIGKSAFLGCSGLTSITIPNSVVSIGVSAFAHCSGLTSLTIPNSVTSIGDRAFQYCSGLTFLTMKPATPPSLGSDVFDGCDNLSTIYVPNDDIMPAYEAVAPWNNYTILPEPSDVVVKTEAILQQMPDDWSNHGLLKDAAQLSSNKVERTEGSLAGLIDGNAATYFHSTWSSTNSDNATHYLQVDLGYALQHLQLKYLRRNQENNAEPKIIRVFATNDPAEGWTETGVAHLPSGTGSETIDLGNSYRYVRFNVEATQYNRTKNGNLYFTWAELGIWNAAGITDDLRQEAETLLTTARTEQEAGALSNATIEALVSMNERLVRGDYLRIKDGGNNFRYTETQNGYAAIHYERDFTHTGWQALYVPFDISYDDLSTDFTVAALNDLHQFDDDNDGLFDRTSLEVRYLRSGDVVKANTPYVIRATATGMQTLVAAGAVLQPMEELNVDCSSILYRYIFSGTYTGVSGADMQAGSYYAMSSGALAQAESDAAALGAYRWYMAVESRTASTAALPRHIPIVESGADLTDIKAVETDTMGNAPIYDLNGRRVGTSRTLGSLGKGIYLVGGKKIIR